MIDGRLRQESVEWIATGSGKAGLVSHESWIGIGTPGTGFGVSYRRPVRIVSDDGRVSVAVHDHVMIARVAGLVVGLGFAIWRLMR
ncbi:MAG TPA: hypothetical protein VFS66_03505 [Acidimicrobiia bacterium]|nr:hypothetical protein [Acidimicrobiia bacterium]